MHVILGAVALVWGLTYAGVRWSERPAQTEKSGREKLAKLRKIEGGRLTLDQAEDGLVLARLYRDSKSVSWFAQHVRKLKPLRVKI